MAGYLEGEAARGLELLAGGAPADILDAALPGGQVSVRVTSACTKSSLEFQGEEPSALQLTCKIEARLAEYRERPADGERKALQAQLEHRVRARLEACLEQLQGWGTDCTGLGARAAMICPARWQAVWADWPGWFGRMPVEIQVEVVLP